jgi:hypothetical protein
MNRLEFSIILYIYTIKLCKNTYQMLSIKPFKSSLEMMQCLQPILLPFLQQNLIAK